MAETNRSSLLQLFQPPVMTVDGVAHHSCPSDTFFSLDTNDVWFNFSQHNFPGNFSEHGSLDFVDHCKILLYLVTLVLALVGNSAVLLAVLKFRNLRGAVNLYCANLVVADILICLCCMWVYLVNHITAPAYILGPFICKINGFVQMTCLTSSVLTLSAISCDRYMAIMFPLRSRVTKKRTDAVIAAIWVCSLVISTPFFLFRRLQTLYWSDYTETNCLEAWPSTTIYSAEAGRCVKQHTFKRVYYTFVSTTLFFAPVLIMLMAYSAIIWKLWVNKVPGEAHYANIRQQKKSKRKVIQMVVVVVFCFIACWLPLQIVILFSLYVHSSEDGVLPEWFPKLSYYSTFIAYSNSVANPLIYGGFNKNFRDALCNNALCGFWWKSRRLKRPQYSTKSLSTMVTSMAGTAGKLDCATPPMGGQHRHNGHGQLHQHKNYQHAHQQQLALGGTYSKTSIGSTTEPSPNASVSNCSVVLVASTTPNNCCSGALNSLTPNSSSTNSQRVKTEAFEMEEFASSEKDSFL